MITSNNLLKKTTFDITHEIGFVRFDDTQSYYLIISNEQRDVIYLEVLGKIEVWEVERIYYTKLKIPVEYKQLHEKNLLIYNLKKLD